MSEDWLKLKCCHYEIDDCFFRYWFRFVFKYRGYLELERYEQLRQIAMRDFDVFSGYALERCFHAVAEFEKPPRSGRNAG